MLVKSDAHGFVGTIGIRSIFFHVMKNVLTPN